MCIVEIIGSLSNLTDDGNGNENVKKATGLRTMPPTENSIFAQFMTMWQRQILEWPNPERKFRVAG